MLWNNLFTFRYPGDSKCWGNLVQFVSFWVLNWTLIVIHHFGNKELVVSRRNVGVGSFGRRAEVGRNSDYSKELGFLFIFLDWSQSIHLFIVLTVRACLYDVLQGLTDNIHILKPGICPAPKQLLSCRCYCL